jgi:hypothetical protein
VWHDSDRWPDQLEWLGAAGEPIRLMDGKWRQEARPDRFAGLSLEEVPYGDLDGDGNDEALVVLRHESGGTQYHYYVYVFTIELRRAKLLTYFRSGDRAQFGLYRVAIEDENLIVDLFDPEGREGDCCSTAIIRSRYRWREDRFESYVRSESGVPASTSRRPVNIFGLAR